MNGARKYANLFKTGQYGRLYFVRGSHARGKTFRIFVLPENVAAIPNGTNNAPLNEEAVGVYGVIDGQPGWSETYGWLFDGKWQVDFHNLVDSELNRLREDEERRLLEKQGRENKELERKKALLATY